MVEDLEEGRGNAANLVEVANGGTDDVLVVGLEEGMELDGFIGDQEAAGKSFVRRRQTNRRALRCSQRWNRRFRSS